MSSTELPKLTMTGLSYEFRTDVLIKRRQYKDLFTGGVGNNTHKLKVTWQTIFLSDFAGISYRGNEMNLWNWEGKLLSFVCREERKKWIRYASKAKKLTGSKASDVKYELKEVARLAFVEEVSLNYDSAKDVGVGEVANKSAINKAITIPNNVPAFAVPAVNDFDYMSFLENEGPPKVIDDSTVENASNNTCNNEVLTSNSIELVSSENCGKSLSFHQQPEHQTLIAKRQEKVAQKLKDKKAKAKQQDPILVKMLENSEKTGEAIVSINYLCRNG